MGAFADKNIEKAIFTSHDLSTMNSEVFRRDEIWFVAKGNEQNSSNYRARGYVKAHGFRLFFIDRANESWY